MRSERESRPQTEVRALRAPALAARTILALALILALPASAGSAWGEVIQSGGIRVAVAAALSPHALPRNGAAPVNISFSVRFTPVTAEPLPQLEAVSVAINSHGELNTKAVPPCRPTELAASTNAGALEACRPSLVGEGHLSAKVRLPQQAPFPSSGRLLAFYGIYRGRPAILAHIYGVEPFPTTYVLPFVISETKGTYGTVLSASLPRTTGEWGYVTGITMSLGGRYTSGSPFVVADCPARTGSAFAAFPLARAAFSFAGDFNLRSVLNRTCEAS